MALKQSLVGVCFVGLNRLGADTENSSLRQAQEPSLPLREESIRQAQEPNLHFGGGIHSTGVGRMVYGLWLRSVNVLRISRKLSCVSEKSCIFAAEMCCADSTRIRKLCCSHATRM